MRVGMVGCGKLGFVVALAMESKGHEVRGYDPNPGISDYLKTKTYSYHENGIGALLESTRMRMVPLFDLCQWADILFLAPQTPHHAMYEGHLPLPETRADFDYSYLKACVVDVDRSLRRPMAVVVISTVLPGTMEREILPLLGERFRLVYSPQFIAMGTVVTDFLDPEFWLIGSYDGEAADALKRFYATIAPSPTVVTDVATAEGIKVFYNTFITTKTVLANLYGEMSYRLGMNVDDIHKALSLSTNRLLSPKYMRAGMGDGGACHPRDNIALSYVAREVGLSFDFFTALMTARERHAEFLADVIMKHRKGLPVFILGTAFKPETNIETGSPALLLSAILHRRGVPHAAVPMGPPPTWGPGLYFIGCQHETFRSYSFPKGSVVIDPFRYLAPQSGVNLIAIGRDAEALVESVA